MAVLLHVLLLVVVLLHTSEWTTGSCLLVDAIHPTTSSTTTFTHHGHHPKAKAVLQLAQGGGAFHNNNKKRLPSSTSKTTTTTSSITKNKGLPALSKIDWGVFGIYFCTAVTMTLPVMIVPMMDAELHLLSTDTAAADTPARSTVILSLASMVASMAPFGGGIGKLVNGFVCQQIGGTWSSRLYFMVSALASLGLASISLTTSSTTTTTSTALLTTDTLGWMVAAIEFCASIQWTVCSLFLSQWYAGQNPALFARGVTILSLASTSGQISSKLLGAFLLQYKVLHWRQLGHIMVAIALLGLAMSSWTSRTINTNNNITRSSLSNNNKAVVRVVKQSAPPAAAAPRLSVRHAITRVLGSRMFWLIGLAHVSGYVTRTSDRVIGTFLQHVTSLSPQLCGGLTAFITVGFVYGLMTSSKNFYEQSTTVPLKLKLLKRGCIRTVISVGGLILSAALGKDHWHPYVSAFVITTCASIMASSIAFPFFQVPNMVSSSEYFADVKPVALSLIDGTGFFLTSPVWKIFTGTLLPRYGWAFSWSVIAVLVSLCGMLMMTTIPTILEMQQQQQDKQQLLLLKRKTK